MREEKIPEITKLLKEVPLKIRVRVCVHMELIIALTQLGLRENKFWSDNDPNDVDLSKKLSTITDAITKGVMLSFSEWETDGRPK